MEDNLSLTHKLYSQIIQDDIPFALALNNAFSDATAVSNNRNVVSSILGCSLRHHYLFSYLAEQIFGKTNVGFMLALNMYIADVLFSKKVTKEDIKKFLFAKSLEENIDDSFNKIEQLNELISSYEEKICEQIQIESNKYLALKYNLPEWLVNMLKRHFGDKILLNILKSNHKKVRNIFRVNEKAISVSEFVASHEDFKALNIPGLVEYTGDKRFNALSNAYRVKAAYKYVFDSLDVDQFRGIAIYLGQSNNFYRELFTRFSNKLKFDIVAAPGLAYLETKKALNNFGASNVSLYEAQSSSLELCVSSKVHTMIVFPENSSLEELRNSPSFFTQIKSEKFDEFPLKQEGALTNASKLVEDGGELVYIVNTMNFKESRGIIHKFLKEHNDFVLVEDRQFLPFDKFDSTLYFANLKKVENAD